MSYSTLCRVPGSGVTERRALSARSRIWLEAHHDTRGKQSRQVAMYVFPPSTPAPHYIHLTCWISVVNARTAIPQVGTQLELSPSAQSPVRTTEAQRAACSYTTSHRDKVRHPSAGNLNAISDVTRKALSMPAPGCRMSGNTLTRTSPAFS